MSLVNVGQWHNVLHHLLFRERTIKRNVVPQYAYARDSGSGKNDSMGTEWLSYDKHNHDGSQCSPMFEGAISLGLLQPTNLKFAPNKVCLMLDMALSLD